MAETAEELATAWRGFCRDLERLGELVQRPATPTNELDQAEGYRFVLRLLRSGLEIAIEHAREPGVAFHEKDQYTHVGFTSPDQDPLIAQIDPRRDYRITGTRGTNAGLGILAMDPSTMKAVGWLNHDDLEVAEDGTFEIIASIREHPGNWLQLTEDTSQLVVHCNFNDRSNETRAQFHLEEIDAHVPDRRPTDAAAVISGMRRAILSTEVMVGRMVEWAEELVERPNEIGVLDSYMRSSGSPDHDFRFGYFEFPPDHALRVRFRPPACDNWQFQIGNWWVENLDSYEDDQGWVNKTRAVLDDDGAVTIIVSPNAVKAANWVDTFGRRSGIMGLRLIRAASSPPVQVDVVEAAAVVGGT